MSWAPGRPELYRLLKSAALVDWTELGRVLGNISASNKIGAVLADICRDLGILPSHPLWRELHLVIIHERGNVALLAMDTIHLVLSLARERWSASPEPTEAAPSLATGCTGPP